MSEWWDIEFCSRNSLLIGNHWYIFRNPAKVVKEKQIYYGTNNEMLRDPSLHVDAIYRSLKSDLDIPLLEDLVQW